MPSKIGHERAILDDAFSPARDLRAAGRRRLERQIDAAARGGIATYVRFASLLLQHYKLPNTVLPFLHDLGRRCDAVDSLIPFALVASSR